MAVIQDKTITLPITFSKTDENQPVEDFVFIRCEFIGGSDFSTNLERKNIVIYESRSRLGKIIFRGQGNASIRLAESNDFNGTEIVFSGEFSSASVSSPGFEADRLLLVLTHVSRSRYSIVRVDYDAVITNLNIQFVHIDQCIKLTGRGKKVTLVDITAKSDVTILTKGVRDFFVSSVKTSQLAFGEDFGRVVLSGKNEFDILTFRLDDCVNSTLNLDMSDTIVTHEFQISHARAADVKCGIRSIDYSKIKRLTFFHCQMQCFSIANCDLSGTHVVFKQCIIDDMNILGVTWPSDVSSVHFNEKIDAISLKIQNQSLYRYLKSISNKNKDVDGYLIFREKEYQLVISISWYKVKSLTKYFWSWSALKLGLKKKEEIPLITHLHHPNKVAAFASEMTSLFILCLSSLISSHGTSLLRPIALLAFGIPLMLYAAGYYYDLKQFLSLSAHVINPAHSDSVTITGIDIVINPILSLFLRFYTSVIFYHLIVSFRRYSNI
ncbi:hypothetical protein V8687_18710 [Shewanella baltica]|uniref:hypothetical protein n=2 Tax=Shewanella baltica TaxID=62322 RepID=UPI0030CE9B55